MRSRNWGPPRAWRRRFRSELATFPDLYHSGYTQDALKEYAEANIVFPLITNAPLPSPEELEVEYATYLQGLAEAAGELRRRCLDILRSGHSQEAERLLSCMDDIYAILVTMDYPDAITGGLRRLDRYRTRGDRPRTRGDMTHSACGRNSLKRAWNAWKTRMRMQNDD